MNRAMQEKARVWLYNEDHPNETASQAEVDDLAALLDEVRCEALEEAAKLCDIEERACMSHARAFAEMSPKSRVVPLSQAHKMAGKQSAACAHYIRALKP